MVYQILPTFLPLLPSLALSHSMFWLLSASSPFPAFSMLFPITFDAAGFPKSRELSTEVCEAVVWVPHLWERREGRNVGQKEKSNCSGISAEPPPASQEVWKTQWPFRDIQSGGARIRLITLTTSHWKPQMGRDLGQGGSLQLRQFPKDGQLRAT